MPRNGRLGAQRYVDLLVIGGVAFAGMLFALEPDGSPLPRSVAAMALVLVLPGLALAAALFPPRTVGIAQRTVTVIAASLSVTVLVGIVIDRTPGGLTTTAWALSLGTVTLAFVLVAAFRRRASDDGLVLVATRDAMRERLVRTTTRSVVLFGAAALITVGALAVAQRGAIDQPRPGFTELWLLPETGSPAVRIGVRNMESGPRVFRVQLRTPAGIVAEWPTVTLSRGETWEQSVAVPAAVASSSFTADLYTLEDRSTPYRHVTLADLPR